MAEAGTPPSAPPIRGFKGLNNRTDPTALGPAWQLTADNVLSDNAGYLVRRPGYSAVLTDITDAYGTKDGRLFVVSSSDVLYEVSADGGMIQRAVGFSGGPFSWAELGYALFAMSDVASWCVYPDRVVAWGIPAMASPAIEVTGGNLPVGTYLVATALEASDGRIGGITGVATLVQDGSQGFIAHSDPVTGYTTRLYLSAPDGKDLYYAGKFSGATFTITSLPTEGPLLETSHAYPPPLGGIISSHGNRMAVGVWEPEHDRSVIYWSLADAPHRFDIEADYQILPGKITMLIDVAGGLLIGTDRAIYVASVGAPAQTIAAFGALPDTAQHINYGQVAFWTERGLAIYPPFSLSTDAAIIPDNRTLSSGAILGLSGSAYYVISQRGERRIKQITPYVPLSVTTTPINT